MNIALIDDIESEIKQMQYFLRSFEEQNKLSFSIDCFSCGEDFLECFEASKYSVVFIDIFMKGMMGTETAKFIREKDKSCIIVFLTSSTIFMPQAFSCHAFEYILKPAAQERVFQVLSDILHVIPNTCRYLEFTCNRQAVKILYSEIVFVVANRHKCELTDREGVTFSPSIGFSKFINPLTDDRRFLLINRGIIVNMDYIFGFENNSCQLYRNICLPVRVRDCIKIKHTWQKYTFAKIQEKLYQKEDTV